jgi:3-hydroxybutyryl-CoA dehydrogenase
MSTSIKYVGIVGAGTMGAGIMINCVTHGIDVVLCDRNQAVLDRASENLSDYLMRQIAKDRITQDVADTIAARLTVATELSDLSNCTLVIEAVFENLDLKKSIFAELEKCVSPYALLASNTSCLRLADISEGLVHKERFCGMHYFSPAEINPVVELIEGPDTSAETLNLAASFLQNTAKEVIRCKDHNGFALNRFFCPYTNEAVRMVDEGLASTGQVDMVAKDTLGLALGPFAVMNIVGTSTNLNAVRNLEPLGPFYKAANGLEKAGTENTIWDIEDTPTAPDNATGQKIADRLIAAVLLPVLEELHEECTTLESIDKGAQMAFRFGKAPGCLLNTIGKDDVQRLITDTADRHGHNAALALKHFHDVIAPNHPC